MAGSSDAPAGPYTPGDQDAGFEPGWNPLEAEWGTCELLDRLQWMSALAPMAPPAGQNPATPGNVSEYLLALRSHAEAVVPPELLVDRRELWSLDSQTLPDYVYLRGRTQGFHNNFHGWKKVIKEDLGCDERACQHFVTLFSKQPKEAPHGYMEACRVLAHTMKDKIKPQDAYRSSWYADPEKPEKQDWSGFMVKACKESIEALEEPAEVYSLKRERKGYSSWDAFTPAAPVDPAGWQPTGFGLDKGKGKGKAMDKGKGLQKGMDKGMYYQSGMR